jgi:hypothetical protein
MSDVNLVFPLDFGDVGNAVAFKYRRGKANSIDSCLRAGVSDYLDGCVAENKRRYGEA